MSRRSRTRGARCAPRTAARRKLYALLAVCTLLSIAGVVALPDGKPGPALPTRPTLDATAMHSAFRSELPGLATPAHESASGKRVDQPALTPLDIALPDAPQPSSDALGTLTVKEQKKLAKLLKSYGKTQSKLDTTQLKITDLEAQLAEAQADLEAAQALPDDTKLLAKQKAKAIKKATKRIKKLGKRIAKLQKKEAKTSKKIFAVITAIEEIAPDFFSPGITWDEPPVNLVAVGGDGQVAFSWDPMEGATSYTLYHGDTPFVSPFDGTPVLSLSTSVMLQGLGGGQTVYAVVTAQLEELESPASQPASATTDETPPSPEPLLALDASNLAFTSVIGDPAPAAQGFQVSNVGDAPLTWSAADDATWLTLNPSSGALASSDAQQVIASVNVAGLPAGVHSALVTVSSPEALNGPLTMVVTLTVSPAPLEPLLDLDTSNLAFASVIGDPAPAAQGFQVSNIGNAPLTWSATTNVSWLTLNPTTGALGVSGTQQVAASVDVAGLSAGVHSALVTVTSPEALNGPLTMVVTLTVSPATPMPLLDLDTSNLAFASVIGDPAPAAQAFQVGNVGDAPLTWSATANASWLTLSPSSGALGHGGTKQVVASVDVSGLTEGVHTALVTVSSPEALNGPLTMLVTLTLSPATPEPLLALDTSNLTFASVIGDPAPAAQGFKVSNIGDAPLTYSATANASWLTLNPTNGVLNDGGAQQVNASVDVSALTEGVHSALVTVSSPEASNGPLTILVTLTLSAVTPEPLLALDTGSLEFASAIGDPAPAAQSFLVGNIGNAPLTWSATANASWLTVSPSSGALGDNGAQQVVASVDVSGLTEGLHTALVTVSSPEAMNGPLNLVVTLTLSPATPEPLLDLDTASLSFASVIGDPAPAAQGFQVSNIGDAPLTYSAAANASWLTLNPTNGALNDGGTQQVNASVNVSGLTEGVHTALVTVASPEATNGPLTMLVTLTLSPATPEPLLDLDTASLSFASVIGDPAPAAQGFQVSNIGDAPLTYSAAGNASWLTLNPTNGALNDGGTQQVNASVNVSGLTEGVHTALVTVASPEATNGPLTMLVTLTLSPATPEPLLDLDTASLSFASVIGDPAPAAQGFQVSNIGDAPLTYSAAANASWLTLNPTNGALNDGGTQQVNASVNVSGLPEGEHTALVTVSSPEALNGPLTLTVTLTLSPAPGSQGLLGDYFDTANLTQLVETRLDPVIDFQNWGAAPTGTSVTPDSQYSERWTGFVSLPQSGNWTFTTWSNDGVRLWIGNVLLIDNWTTHTATSDSGALSLTAGWHAVRLEHYQSGGSAVMQLLFAGPGQTQVIVPAANLSPNAGGNQPPFVMAGPDQQVQLPSSSANLSATGGDPDGAITKWAWSQAAGPPVTILAGDTPTPLVSGLTTPGDYAFDVTVTDDQGTTSDDSTSVTLLAAGQPGATVSGTLKTWHRVTVDFAGPQADENDSLNPFRDYRLQVTYVHAASGTTYVVPGFFAADGLADESGATSGNVWRTHFAPDRPGTWTYTASFRQGADVSINLAPNAGSAASFDGASGSFAVAPTDLSAPGFRSEGRLDYVDEHYLRFAGSGRAFLKGGADSPENFLGYTGFDQTPDGTHVYGPHVADWAPGDPVWHGNKGKGIIGALNYLAGKGMNSVYFLTFNVAGDGDDVWPWTTKSERHRFDCSKLDQWEIVFDHMDALGIQLHVVTQEQENDNGSAGLDGGALGTERMLYYRELVARFGHHLGVTWNLGEENGNTDAQRKDFYDYFHAQDPYDHPVVLHTYPNQQSSVYGAALNVPFLEGASLQLQVVDLTHTATRLWRDLSAASGLPWVVTIDEFGPSTDGVVPDAQDFWHDEIRKQGLWGNLMAGGAGAEWYFGYNFAHSDLTCEDWRSRDHMWDLTAIGLDFFQDHLPFDQMAPDDTLVDFGAWCFAKTGETYAVYLPDGGSTQLDLAGSTDSFNVRWYDPRTGGALQTGSVLSVTGPGKVSLGTPPGAPLQDWALLIQRQ